MKTLEPQWFQGFFTPKSFAVDKDAEEGIL